MEKIKVLIVETDKAPYEAEIENTLEAKQEIVQGYIEFFPLENGVDIVCNEEGKINGLPLNRAIYDEGGGMVEVIAGTFLIVSVDAYGDVISLTKEQMDWYKKKFAKPEKFFFIGKQLFAVPRD